MQMMEIQPWLISEALEITCIYEKDSESSLSLDKTECIWFGSMADRKDCPVNIKWWTDSVKVPGILSASTGFP